MERQNNETKSKIPLTMATTFEPRMPAKHSEEFFENRIKDLQDEIKENVPSSDEEAMKSFVGTCKSLQIAMQAKEKADNLLQKLEEEKASDDAIHEAQDLVDACEQTVESINDAVTSSGQAALERFDLARINEAALLECTILIQATPKGLADFCSQDPPRNCALVDKFLGNIDWMKQMITSGGASRGHYGPAISIHSQLLEEMADNPTKVRLKLALATALEHATPIPVFKHEEELFIDPIHRFWHYVNAYENGELDSNFENFSIWELRLVVDSNAPDDQLAWGRSYLKKYRPDEVLSDSDQWRYLWSVRTDVGYRHPDHDFHTYQDLISAGGECGARAWFGRFICKSFGTPTWGVRQPGHAALSRWTPSGWLMCMGRKMKYSFWDETRYNDGRTDQRHGLDFLEEAEARNNVCECNYYEAMSLLECVAESLGETITEQVDPSKPWRSLSLAQRRMFAQAQKSEGYKQERLEGISSDFKSNFKIEDNTLLSSTSGCIVIPASEFVQPDEPSSTVQVMPSFLGALQIHLEQDGSVAYEMPSVVAQGTYQVSVRIVNVHRHQVPLLVTVENPDDDDITVDLYRIEVPYTMGEWEYTEPIEINLVAGGLLKLSREPPCWGLSMKDIVLANRV